MDYCKITTDARPQLMPNPFRVTVANPDEEQKAQLAEMFGWLEMVYAEEPEYDPETQYVTDSWEEEDGKAVQHWEVHDKPVPEPDGWTEARDAYEDGVNNV